MKRRTVMGAAGLWPMMPPAHAQPARRPARIGILGTTASSADMRGAQPRSHFASALFVVNSGLFDHQAARITSLVAQRRLPAMYGLRIDVEAGGLMAYGADLLDNWRRAASFVDRILTGASPADLPVEQPTKFNWVINLQVAQALGLTIPPPLRLRADEVIG